MKTNDKTEESLRFVASHYRDDTLLPGPGWKLFRSHNGISSFRRNLVAACVGAAVLAASASIYYLVSPTTADPSAPPADSISAPAAKASIQKIERIEFHDAPLSEVVGEVERTYGVTITGVPAADMRITISYEGTAADVVEVINDLLDTHLTITTDTISEK